MLRMVDLSAEATKVSSLEQLHCRQFGGRLRRCLRGAKLGAREGEILGALVTTAAAIVLVSTTKLLSTSAKALPESTAVKSAGQVCCKF